MTGAQTLLLVRPAPPHFQPLAATPAPKSTGHHKSCLSNRRRSPAEDAGPEAMSEDLNRCQLIGRLSKPVEMKFTASGKAVASFDLAVNGRKVGDKNETYWVPIVAWTQTAEFLSKYGEKGQQLAVSGRLQTRTYETQDGQKRKVMEVVADSVQLLARTQAARADQYDGDIPF